MKDIRELMTQEMKDRAEEYLRDKSYKSMIGHTIISYDLIRLLLDSTVYVTINNMLIVGNVMLNNINNTDLMIDLDLCTVHGRIAFQNVRCNQISMRRVTIVPSAVNDLAIFMNNVIVENNLYLPKHIDHSFLMRNLHVGNEVVVDFEK